jgi:hypothetical protein
MSGRIRLGVSAGFQFTHEPMCPFREELFVLPVKPLRYRRIEPGTISAFRMKGVRRPRKTPVWIVGVGSRFKWETSRKQLISFTARSSFLIYKGTNLAVLWITQASAVSLCKEEIKSECSVFGWNPVLAGTSNRTRWRGLEWCQKNSESPAFWHRSVALLQLNMSFTVECNCRHSESQRDEMEQITH